MKNCKYCQMEIDDKAIICPNCKRDLRNIFMRHKILATIFLIIGIPMIVGMIMLSTFRGATTIFNSNSINAGNSKETLEKRYINLNEIIKAKDWEVKINEIKFGQRINPSKQPKFYSYYQVEDTDNTYLCVVLECKNISELELSANTIATVKAKYKDKYVYSSFSTIEDATLGFTYSSITRIDPLTSKKVYYLAEMPKTVANEKDTTVEVEIKIDNKSYYYKLR